MTNIITKAFEGGRTAAKSLTLTTAAFLAVIISGPLSPLSALYNGSPAVTVIGQPGMTQNSPNTVGAAGLGLPQNAAADPVSGRVYVADAANNRVLWWNSASLANGHAADGVIGQAGFSGAFPNQGGLTGPNTLSAPAGVAVDSAGSVWVADSGNNRVIRFPAPALNNANADVVLGQPNFLNNGFNISAAALHGPVAVAVDGGGNVWVADNGNNRVLKYNSPGAVNGPAAALVLGQANFTAGGRATTQTGLNSPMSMAVDGAGNIWVADSGNNRVVEYASPGATGASAAFVLGQTNYTGGSPNQGLFPMSAATLSAPQGVAARGTDIWVADTNNNRLLKFTNPLAGPMDPAAALQLGQADAVSGFPNRNGAVATANTLNLPTGAFVDGAGNVLAADSANHRILRYASGVAAGGAAALVLGQRDFAQFAANTVMAQGLYGPNAIALDPVNNRVYAADYNNNRVLWWNSALAFSNGRAADGVLGQPDFNSMLPNQGGVVTAGTFSAPYSVAVDAAGNLWVNDTANSRILRFTGPVSNGNLATIAIGQASLTSTLAQTPGSPAQNSISGASGIAIDAAGRLWVADSGNNRVLRFSALATGAPADFVVGQADYISAQPNGTTGNPPTANTLSFPTGVSLDAAGDLWVSDSGNSRVLKYPASVLPPASLLVGPGAALTLGQTLLTTAASGNSQTTLNNPGGVMVDPSGTPVWVADSFNSRVLRFDAPAANAAPAALVLGQADFTGSLPNRGASMPAADTLATPNAVLATPSAYWIVDTGNNRLLLGSQSSTTRLSPAFTAISSNSLAASWTPTGSINGYVAVFSSNSNFAPLISSGPLTAATTSFTGLNPSTSYYLEVKLSTEPDSAYALNFAAAQTSSSVTGLSPSFTAATPASLTVAWNALPGVSYFYQFSASASFSSIISSGTQLPAAASFTGLSPSTAYYFAVSLSTEGAAALAANTVTGHTSPVPATLLYPAASGLSGSGFTVTWTNTGATYNVVLSSDSAMTQIISSAAQSGSTIAYGSLAEYTTYYFEVKLSTEADAAYVPNALAVRTLALHAPLSPAFYGASAYALSAAWTSVPGAQYTVVFSTTSNFAAAISSFTQSASTAAFTGLTPDTSYYLEVKLSTDTDAAFAINTVMGRTSPLGTRLGILMNANSSSMISVTWPYYPGVSYNAVLALDPLFSNRVSVLTTGPGEYNENYTGLTGLTTYYYELKLTTETNAGFAFNTASAFTPATQLFPNPEGVTGSGFTITWSTASGANYAVILAADSGYTAIISSSTQSSGSKTFSGLASGTMYYFAVKVANEGDAAYADLANRGAQTTLAEPLNPVLDPATSTTLTATWTPVAGATYIAALASDPSYMTIIASGALTANTTTYTGLAPYTTYYFEMKLDSQNDFAYASNTAARRTLPVGTALSPYMVSLSSQSIKAVWTPVLNSTYVAVLATDPGYSTIVSSLALQISSYTYTGLSGNATYYFEVKLSTESDLAYILNRTAGRTNPTQLAPSLWPAGAGTLGASWAAVPGAYFSAQLAMDAGFTRIVSSMTTESTIATFTKLIGNLPYYMRVKLAGEANSSFAINQVSATPPAGSLRIDSVTPNTAIYGGWGANFTINGSGITFGPTIKLMKAGQPDMVADNVVWHNASQVSATIHDPTAPGRWTVLVTGDVETTALPDSFVVLTADPGSAKIYQGIFKPLQGQSAQLTTSLLVPGRVSVRVYDTLGRRVRELFNGNRVAGDYLDIWDGRTDTGSMGASGVYLVRFETPEFKTTKRVVLIK